jgi:cytochrome c peroxidase
MDRTTRVAKGIGVTLFIFLIACSDVVSAAPRAHLARSQRIERRVLVQNVRALAAGRGVVPEPLRPTVRPALSRLGRLLAFDKTLSGDHDVSCMTCHLLRFSPAALRDTDVQTTGQAVMRRLGRVPLYRAMFEAAYPGTRFDDMTFAYATNAIAGYLTANGAFDRSPWDRFLAGDDSALTVDQLVGVQRSLTRGCSSCHTGVSGSLQFHDVALAQFGLAEGAGTIVELTGPYEHAGAFQELRAFVAHYSQSERLVRSGSYGN